MALKRLLLALGFVLAVVLSVVYGIKPVAAQAAFLEDFEDEQPLDPPSASWYDLAVSGTHTQYVTGDEAKNGGQSWLIDSGSSASAIGFDHTSSFDLCDGGDLSFWFRLSAAPSSSDVRIGAFKLNQNSITGNGWMVVQVSNVLLAQVSIFGSSTDQVTLGTIALDTWYDIRITDIDCPTASARFVSQTLARSDNVDAAGSISALSFFTVTSAFAMPGPVYVDDVSYTGLNVAATNFGSTASIAIDNLAGFDVDHSGAVAIARYDDDPADQNQEVGTFNAGSLNQNPTVLETFCNRLGGVAALATHVSFLQCDSADAGDVTHMIIRGANLQVLKGEACVTSDMCDDVDLNDEDLASPDDDLREISAIQEFPFDFSKGKQATTFHKAYAAWGFSTSDGRAGVVTQNWVNNAPDSSYVDLKVIDPAGGIIDLMCITRDADQRNWLYAGSFDSNVQGFLVEFTKNTGLPVANQDTIVPKMTKFFPGSATTDEPLGIGCGEGKFAVLTETDLTVWQCRTCSGKAPIITIPLTSTVSNGVVMSDNGQWVAYVDSLGGHIICANSPGCDHTAGTYTPGQEVATFTLPAGDFQYIRMQGAGSQVWVATTDVISRYEVFTATSGEDTAYDPGAVDLPNVTVTQTGTPGGVLGTGNLPEGWTVAAFNGFMAIVLIGAVSAGFFFILGKSVIGALIGGLAGVFLAFFLGLLALWVIIFIGVIGASVTFLGVRRAAGA